MFKILHKQKSGFTLLEVLIAIFILTLGLVTVLGLMSYNIKQGSGTMNEVIAGNLAREGIEVVRNIRDTNLKKGDGWNDGLSDTGANEMNVNYDSNALENLDDELYLSGNKYIHDSMGSPTIFKRYIQIDDENLDTEGYIEIQSIVKWGSEKITLTDHLYDLSP